jgi:hypothetical protein
MGIGRMGWPFHNPRSIRTRTDTQRRSSRSRKSRAAVLLIRGWGKGIRPLRRTANRGKGGSGEGGIGGRGDRGKGGSAFLAKDGGSGEGGIGAPGEGGGIGGRGDRASYAFSVTSSV